MEQHNKAKSFKSNRQSQPIFPIIPVGSFISLVSQKSIRIIQLRVSIFLLPISLLKTKQDLHYRVNVAGNQLIIINSIFSFCRTKESGVNEKHVYPFFIFQFRYKEIEEHYFVDAIVFREFFIFVLISFFIRPTTTKR